MENSKPKYKLSLSYASLKYELFQPSLNIIFTEQEETLVELWLTIKIWVWFVHI